MECPECGNIASRSDLFCGECGAVLATPLAPEPVIEPSASEPAASTGPSPPYSAASHTAAVRDSRANAAFILGIVSIVLTAVSCLPFVSIMSCLGPVSGIVAIVLGAIAKRDLEVQGGSEADRKKAHQGMIMGIAATGLYLALMVLGITLGIGLGVLGELW